MESSGTLPCASEIPDCAEQVRGGGLRTLLAFRSSRLGSGLRCLGGPSPSLCRPCRIKVKKSFFLNRCSEVPQEATAWGVRAGVPQRASSSASLR